ncbi:MAG TPA: hypothetical protein VK750_06435 [Cytophagaceae bacterium]|jgi:hypothetical protein|nr:hypothetical protein [Cytophagaceae bacterium]
MKFRLFTAVLLISFFFLGINPSRAQTTTKSDFENSRIAYITEQVKLSPEQADKFWPLYNEFTAKRIAIKRSIRQSRQRIANENNNEEVVKQMLFTIQQKKQESLTLENEYLPKFMKVISAQQVASLAKAERKFLAKTLKQLPDNTEADD